MAAAAAVDLVVVVVVVVIAEGKLTIHIVSNKTVLFYGRLTKRVVVSSWDE